MTIFVRIGATDETEIPCHSLEQWHAMLDANRRGDIAAVERLLATPPKMIAMASMLLVPTADEADELPEFAREFWRKYRQRNGEPEPVQRDGVQFDVAPNRANKRTNDLLQRIAEMGGGQP
ncbi:hypothetical protein FY036_15805 [Mesorhizobium microcysteis]|uniref:Uncharacterized protein n=1 Tax=Neoaquamicrobium microcysteis TaxID=2682781 RepID=A0A5D4GUE7_9HYPH|nr:hypothetical protein [Mesorhizobium microcysteis]TYR30915.1 hypothetical protein FY036_15805 [Mesorhizobium microcysteis]